MNVLIELAHPAHFHYVKHTISNLERLGNRVVIAITSKDILEQLVKESGYDYINIQPIAHRKNMFGYIYDMVSRVWLVFVLCVRYNIDLLLGSTIEIAFVSWLLRRKDVNIGEDDASVLGTRYIRLLFPFVSCRLTPKTCDNGCLESYSAHFVGYMELGYLHPNHFTPCKSIVSRYDIDLDTPYFIIRFSKLNAHHDKGIKGINAEIAQHLIDILEPRGRVYITSERELEPQFEKYRVHINPLDMHHVMAFASLYIGDSQTMAAEAGVLGVPFVRFNDFVGRIGYLRELEDVYHLGFGIRADETPFIPKKVDWIDDEPVVQPSGALAMYKVVEELVSMPAEERKHVFQQRRQRMLADKIDYSKFLTWFVENYPSSADECRYGVDWNRWK